MKLCTGTEYTTLTGKTIADAYLDAATRFIVEHTGRRIERATRTEWLPGTGHGYMLVPEWPVHSMTWCAAGRALAAEITYAGTGTPMVRTQGGSLWLSEVAATPTATEITLSGKTIATLGTAIAAVSGWGMTGQVSALASVPAVALVPCSYGMTPGMDVSTFRASLEVPDTPIPAVIRDPRSRMLEAMESNFPRAPGMVFLWYDAGYDEDSGTGKVQAPADLRETCANVARVLEQWAKRGDIQSERLADYAWSAGGDARPGGDASRRLAEMFGQVLAPHCRYEL